MRIFCLCIDGRWYESPVWWDTDRTFFVCLDDPEIVMLRPGLDALKLLQARGFRKVTMNKRRSCFGRIPPWSEKFTDSICMTFRFYGPAPIPDKFDAVFLERPEREGVYYGKI